MLSYCPDTGELRWLEQRWTDSRGRPRAFSRGGQKAGCLRRDGKVVVSIGGRLYLASRVIWKLVHGEEPICIDHINGNPADNRLCNLRNVTQQENNRNLAARRCTSGHAGVSYRADRRAWRAYVSDSGARIHLGYFKTKDEAVAARLKAQQELGYTERHGKPRAEVSA